VGADVTGGVLGTGVGTVTGGWGLCGGRTAQLVKVPTIASNIRSLVMGLIVLEALGALLLLVLIVWWTMFSGRKKGELKSSIEDKKQDLSAQKDADKK
jgi:hypothetical protein